MPEIIPIRDLKNTNAISQHCHETQEPIFVTKSGYGDMVIMSIRAPRMLSGEFLFMRHGICVAKMLDNVGLRYPHRASGAKAPRTLRPLPLLRFAVSATGGAHLCSIQYYLRFWLGICRTSLAVSALRIMRYCLYKTFHGTSFWEYPPVGAHADVSSYRRTKYQPDVHSNLYGL